MSLYLDGNADLAALSGGRELDYMPWHFTIIQTKDIAIDSARSWIWKNLEGRFCVSVGDYQNNYMTSVGFEEPMEASAFVLSTPLMTPDSWFEIS